MSSNKHRCEKCDNGESGVEECGETPQSVIFRVDPDPGKMRGEVHLDA
jgi:hypothetical protein